MYPDSALSAWQLAIMAVVVAIPLAAWLILVFLAAREPRGTSAAVNAGPREEETAATVTQLPSGDARSGQAAVLSDPADTITWRCDDRLDCQATSRESVGLAG